MGCCDLKARKGSEVEPQCGAHRPSVSTLQEVMLDRHEVERLVVCVGEVASPQLQAVTCLFPGDGCAQQGVEGLAHGVGLVPVDVARGTHVGRQREQFVAVAAYLERVAGLGKQGVHRRIWNAVTAMILLAVVVVLEGGTSETIT